MVSCIIANVFGCGFNKYFKNCPTHHTTGSPCNRVNLGAKSSGTVNGKKGGLGDKESIIGNVKTCTSGVPKKKFKHQSSNAQLLLFY